MQVYDSDGNMTIWYLNGVKITNNYENNQLKESTQWQENKIEIKTRYRYKYDSQGNWIEQYEYNNYPNSSGILFPNIYAIINSQFTNPIPCNN